MHLPDPMPQKLRLAQIQVVKDDQIHTIYAIDLYGNLWCKQIISGIERDWQPINMDLDSKSLKKASALSIPK